MKERRIDDHEIHLWQLRHADFDSSEIEARCLSWLTEDELRRYRRYRLDRSRHQLLLSRILLRIALSSYDGSVAPQDWRFSHNDYGKPALSAGQDGSMLRFNLSHSGQRAVLAVTRGRDVGVDIELAQKPRRIAAIAGRFFSAQEAEALLSLPRAQQLDRFYDLWTLKEAYIKACGMGLAIPLSHFSYSFVGAASIALEFDAQRDDRSANWQLWQLDAGLDYRLSLAAKFPAQESRLQLAMLELKALDKVVEGKVKIRREG